MSEPVILVTGFPGFLAGQLIPRLAQQSPEARIVALVEPRMVELARELAPPGVEVLQGDIADPQLGLSAVDRERLTASTVAVHHLAAIYDLAVGAALAERVNVSGTAHVLDYCRACPRLERLHYVSTAYVAGLRSGLVMEEELAEGQTFKNHYESTKFAAEVLVRAAMGEIPATVYRPAIVVGDSRTGETRKFDGPYYMLRTIAASKGPLMQIGRDDAPFNVVPVDFVIDAIVAGAGDQAAVGKTLHLVDPEPVSSAELFRILAREYDGRTPSFRVPPGVIDQLLRFPAARKFYGGTPRQSLLYLNHPVSFDVTQAAEVLGRAGLRCPRLPEYAGAMVGFFKAHQRDPAFAPARSA